MPVRGQSHPWSTSGSRPAFISEDLPEPELPLISSHRTVGLPRRVSKQARASKVSF